VEIDGKAVGIELGATEIEGRKLGLLEGGRAVVSVGFDDGWTDGTVLNDGPCVGLGLIEGCKLG